MNSTFQAFAAKITDSGRFIETHRFGDEAGAKEWLDTQDAPVKIIAEGSQIGKTLRFLTGQGE